MCVHVEKTARQRCESLLFQEAVFHNVFSVSDTSRRAAVHVALEPIKLKVKSLHALCFKRSPGRTETLEEWVTKGTWWRGVVLSARVFTFLEASPCETHCWFSICGLYC